MILLHEVAHAIFDAETAGATLDFYNPDLNKLAEARADAFAQQVLVPKIVLQHIAQKHGIQWNALSAESLARLVAETHAEQRAVLRSALENELISFQLFEHYSAFDIAATLPSLSHHALSTEEYIRVSGTNATEWKGKRNTTIPSRTMRLPSSYIKAVTEAFKNGNISRGKAAAMLMIDEDVFQERFGNLAGEEDLFDSSQAQLALA